MTICALLLARQFFRLEPTARLKYRDTLGLLFVNVSIGGTLTQFAAPPVLMVARPWNWGYLHMLTHFGWKAFRVVGCDRLHPGLLPGVSSTKSSNALSLRACMPEINRSEDGVD